MHHDQLAGPNFIQILVCHRSWRAILRFCGCALLHRTNTSFLPSIPAALSMVCIVLSNSCTPAVSPGTWSSPPDGINYTPVNHDAASCLKFKDTATNLKNGRTTTCSSSRMSSTSMYLPWPWPWFRFFVRPTLLVGAVLATFHCEYENYAHPVLLQMLVHTDLGHHYSSARGDPHMGSIGLGACQRLFPVVHSLQHLRPTRVRTFVVRVYQGVRMSLSRTILLGLTAAAPTTASVPQHAQHVL
ncbi:hypothetical protein C8R48DRAFT_328479 [Suillus tomentosus]|nr:hypothetical protein C8R48DRAFT_328479 [Suillus tomentosus]